VAAQVAQILRGKDKVNFAYNADCGDYVIVINAEKAIFTGNKGEELIYWHTQWPGGLRNISREKMMAEKPERMVEKVIWGMMPKGPLGRQMMKKLKIYTGTEHPHGNHSPEPLEIRTH
jgi:large subunit ribosomal protein L13